MNRDFPQGNLQEDGSSNMEGQGYANSKNILD